MLEQSAGFPTSALGFAQHDTFSNLLESYHIKCIPVASSMLDCPQLRQQPRQSCPMALVARAV